MHFLSFLILLILGAFASSIVHWAIGYRIFAGIEGLFGKWIVGWLGAWLGPAIVGPWFGPVMLWHIYIIPAKIDAFVGALGVTGCCRVRGKVHALKEIPAGPRVV